MSTNYGSMPTNSVGSLYKGEERGRNLGEVLKSMSREGREVIHSQRTRWRENRYYFRGEQWLESNVIAGQVRTAQRDIMRGTRQRDVFNRLRQMVDGRVSLLTTQRPTFEVVPQSQDQEMISAARQATKFMRTKWGVDEWDLDRVYRDLALAGEIDGCVFLNVIFDPSKGGRTKIALGMDGQPITDPAQLQALRDADPLQEELWREKDVSLGEVVFRIVRANRLSIDPFAEENFRDARWIVETDVRPRDEVEAEAGKKLDDLMKGSKQAMGMGGYSDNGSMSGSVNVDDAEGNPRSLDRKNAVIVHEAFVIPHGDWPRGAHVKWADVAPGEPLLVEPWEDELPYIPYTPKPDGGNFLRCHGTVDDLKPIQTRYNRILVLLHDVLDRMARPPIGFPIGAVRGNSIYNAKGYFEYHAAMGQPWYMNHPGEPAQFLTHHLQYMVNEMAEIASQTNAVRGQAPGQGVESAVGVNMLIQQTEQQVSGTAAQLQRVIEWSGSRALKLVGRHYIYPRLVNSAGVDDAEEFKAFVGEQLRGCTNLRITSPLTPKSRALQMQTLMQFAGAVGPDIRPYISRFIDGDVDEFIAHEEAQAKRQRRENRVIASIAAEQKAETIYADFQKIAQKYAEAMRGLQTAIANGMAPMGNPTELLAARGITPPKFTDMLRDAGIMVPTVEEYDNDPQHLLELDQWSITDGFEKLPPTVAQVAREHRRDHREKLSQQLVAMGDQSMPEPGQKGEPSPAKPKGTPGGQPGQAGPQGGGRPQTPTAAGPTMGAAA